MTRVKILLALVVLAMASTGIGYVVGHTGQTELRVEARSRSDGRIEFRIDAEGEKLTPKNRYMSAQQIAVQDDKWLRSSQVYIGEPASRAPVTDAGTACREVPCEAEFTATDSGVGYAAVRDWETGQVRTTILVAGSATGIYDGALGITCRDGQIRVGIVDLPYISEEVVTVRYGVGGAVYRVNGAASASNDGVLIVDDAARAMIGHLRTGTTLNIRIAAYSRSYDGAFDLTGLFSTPIQPNIDHCGSY